MAVVLTPSASEPQIVQFRRPTAMPRGRVRRRCSTGICVRPPGTGSWRTNGSRRSPWPWQDPTWATDWLVCDAAVAPDRRSGGGFSRAGICRVLEWRGLSRAAADAHRRGCGHSGTGRRTNRCCRTASHPAHTPTINQWLPWIGWEGASAELTDSRDRQANFSRTSSPTTLARMYRRSSWQDCSDPDHNPPRFVWTGLVTSVDAGARLDRRYNKLTTLI